jgi:hypothetical protein
MYDREGYLPSVWSYAKMLFPRRNTEKSLKPIIYFVGGAPGASPSSSRPA